MKRGYFIFMTGTLVGMIFQQYVLKGETSVGAYIIYFTLIMIFSFKKSSEVFGFFLISTVIVMYPIMWMISDIKWYEPLIFLWLMYVLYVNVFNKVERPITVDVNDVLRFPPQFVPQGNESMDNYEECFS